MTTAEDLKMAWLRVKRGIGNNSKEIQMDGELQFEMTDRKLSITSIEPNGEECVFSIYREETEKLREFLGKS